MKKGKKNNLFIIVLGAIIVVLFCYFFLLPNKPKVDDTIFVFNENNIELKIGESKKIDYSTNKENATIKWVSLDKNVSIDNNGIVTANDYGQSLIMGILYGDDNKTITNTCYVSTYSGNINIPLNDIIVPEGYLLMKPNSEFELPFMVDPQDAYTTSINYYIDDEDIVTVSDGMIISRNLGTAIVSMNLNNQVSKEITVKVVDNVTENKFVKDVESVTINDGNLTMEYDDTKQLSYTIYPEDSYANDIKWVSSDENVVSVNDGLITANDVGSAIVEVTIDGKISSSININVKATNADLVVDRYPKTLIRIGEKTNIKLHVDPIKIKDNVTYKSSNFGVASVSNGVITGVSSGTATITATLSNGKSKSFTVNVLPKSGKINGSANLWGYKSLNAKVPTLADSSFYKTLALNGVGIMSGDNYTISSDGVTYSYNCTNEALTVKGMNIRLRIYYPKGEDLSSVNTLVFMGGRGETNFYGMFSDAKKDPSIIKSAGMIGLVAEGTDYTFTGDAAAYVTKFMKAITKQNSGVKNSVLGFSDGAHRVTDASKLVKYDRMVIFSGYVNFVEYPNAKNAEVIFMIASKDGNYRSVPTNLNNMKKYGYSNVTVVTNGTEVDRFSSNFLIIHPGNLLRNGHLSINVLNSKIIEYLND